jgi:hypothetical protein
MGNLFTARVGNILTVPMGNVLTARVGNILDIYKRQIRPLLASVHNPRQAGGA